MVDRSGSNPLKRAIDSPFFPAITFAHSCMELTLNKKRDKKRSHTKVRNVTTDFSRKARSTGKNSIPFSPPSQKKASEKILTKSGQLNTDLTIDNAVSSGSPRYCFNTEIPERYNETYIIAIPKDPNWLYVYWEFSAETAQLMDSSLEQSGSKLVLRLKETDVEETLENVVPFQIDVNELSDGHYMEVPENCRQFQIECGCFVENGSYTPIIQSDPVTIPQSDYQRFDIFASDEENSAALFDTVNNPVSYLSAKTQLDRINSQTCSSYSKHTQVAAGSIF
jgi:hypothetical protein